jgi:hypothetical protein
MRRKAVCVPSSLVARIDALDPERYDERIVDLTSDWLYANPVLFTLTYTHLFTRHVAVPSIANLLYRGGQGDAVVDIRQRNDETLRLFGEWHRYGHRSERGRRATAQVRERHSHFAISQDDLRYVLATLIFEPRRLLSQFDLEPLTRTEEPARFTFWRELGHDLGIQGVPDHLENLRNWMLDYEQCHYRHTASGRRLAELAHQDWAARWLPAPLRPLLARLPAALMDEHLRTTHQFAPPIASERALLSRAIRGYFALLRLHPPRRPRYASEQYERAMSRRAAPASR